MWRSIKTLPDNEFVILGIWVHHVGVKGPQPEFYIAKYCPIDNEFYDISFKDSIPWAKKNFHFWMPIPKLKAIK